MLGKRKPSRLWSMIKSLNGKRAETPPNQPITFSSKSLTRNVEAAKAFTKQFTSAVSHICDPSARIFWRKLHNECQLDNSVSRFSLHIILQAIKNSGNSLATSWSRWPYRSSPEKPGPPRISQPHSPSQLLNQPLQYSRYLRTCNHNPCSQTP